MEEQFYDVVDSAGNVVETAAEQQEQAGVPLERKPPELSPLEIRKLRKQYVTVKHPIVNKCGHSLDLNRKPRTNCEFCIFAWFNSHGEICQQLDEMRAAGGDDLIIQLQGVKFYKMWLRFMSTVANWKKEQEEMNEQTSGTSSSS